MPANPKQPVDSATVARNFMNQYGKAKFKRFIKLLKDGTSGEAIAEEYGVSRERVRQWKNAFGSVVQSYDVAPDIQKLAGLR